MQGLRDRASRSAVVPHQGLGHRADLVGEAFVPDRDQHAAGRFDLDEERGLDGGDGDSLCELLAVGEHRIHHGPKQVQVAKLAKPAKPPADPRKAGRKARRRNRTSPRAKTLSPKRHRYPNEVKRASEAWASLAKQDPSIAVRQGALPKWFKLSSLPEGPRRGLLELQQQLPAPRALRQSDAPLERSRTQLRPMSSYAHACLEFTKGAPSPMLFEEPWHRPESAAPPEKGLGRSLEAGSNDPLGVEPIAMTRRMEKWHGRRALVSPGHRGRPRPQSVPA